MNELYELKSQINNIFEDLMHRFDPADEATSSGEWTPRVDLYELPDRVVLRADVPGVSIDDLEVRVEGGSLVLRGKRPQPRDIDPSSLCRVERPFGSFLRRYALPDSIDPDQVRANCRDGVLEIVIPKREKTSVRRIQIRGD